MPHCCCTAVLDPSPASPTAPFPASCPPFGQPLPPPLPSRHVTSPCAVTSPRSLPAVCPPARSSTSTFRRTALPTGRWFQSGPLIAPRRMRMASCGCVLLHTATLSLAATQQAVTQSTNKHTGLNTCPSICCFSHTRSTSNGAKNWNNGAWGWGGVHRWGMEKQGSTNGGTGAGNSAATCGVDRLLGSGVHGGMNITEGRQTDQGMHSRHKT